MCYILINNWISSRFFENEPSGKVGPKGRGLFASYNPENPTNERKGYEKQQRARITKGGEDEETIGHMHDDVILLLRPESFSFFLSYLNFVIPVSFK